MNSPLLLKWSNKPIKMIQLIRIVNMIGIASGFEEDVFKNLCSENYLITYTFRALYSFPLLCFVRRNPVEI